MKLPKGLATMRFLRRPVAARRAHLGEDLIARLAQVQEGGDRLTEDELVAMLGILLIAGYETTVNLIATGTLLLLGYLDQLARPCAEPALIGSAVEDLLRLATPGDVATERYAREDVERGGVTIPRGALVLVAIVAANADETRFPESERLDVARGENRPLAFGLGPHYCLGAPLACRARRIAIEGAHPSRPEPACRRARRAAALAAGSVAARPRLTAGVTVGGVGVRRGRIIAACKASRRSIARAPARGRHEGSRHGQRHLAGRVVVHPKARRMRAGARQHNPLQLCGNLVSPRARRHSW